MENNQIGQSQNGQELFRDLPIC